MASEASSATVVTPENYQAVSATACAQFVEQCLTPNGSGGWEVNKDKDGEKAQVAMSMNLTDKIGAFRGVARINVAPATLFGLLSNIEHLRTVDKYYGGSDVLSTIDAAHSTMLVTYKLPVIKDRDFVVLKMNVQVNDSTWVCLSQGADVTAFGNHPAVDKKKIRGEIHQSGYCLKAVEGEANATDLYFIAKVDIKGDVPKALSKLTKDAPLVLGRVRQYATGAAVTQDDS